VSIFINISVDISHKKTLQSTVNDEYNLSIIFCSYSMTNFTANEAQPYQQLNSMSKTFC